MDIKDTGERLIVKGHEQTLTYGEHLSRYKAVLDLTAGKVVLDIASGTGYGSQLIAKKAKKVIGIDYSPEAVQYSQANYPAHNLSYMVGDAHHMELDDHSIDIVVSFETIEHLKDPEQFIKEVKRVLKPGGQFVVSTPNDDEFMEGNEFHIHEFDYNELHRLISKNFKNSEYYYQSTYFSAGLFSERHLTSQPSGQTIAFEKTFGQLPKSAIFFIALASDETIGSLNENIVLADAWSTKVDFEREIVRKNKLQAIEETQDKLEDNIDELQKENKAVLSELTQVKASRSWRYTAYFRRVMSKIRQ
jgi:ubiquinone/menaquinone biosynthesis C-methylase UbiE